MADPAGDGDGDGDETAEPDAPPPDRPPVLLDVMCGKLATYLRICGYDAAYALDRGVEADERILSLAADEGRLLLTRDRELAARAAGRDEDALLLTEREVLDQLREVAEAGLPVELAESPTRCGACNGPVERIGPGSVDVAPDDRPDYVPDDVGTSPADASAGDVDAASDDTEVNAASDDADAASDDTDADDTPRPAWRCRDCGQWFWKGSHWASVAARLDDI